MAKKKSSYVPASVADRMEAIEQMEQNKEKLNQQLEELLEHYVSNKPSKRKAKAKTIHLFNEAEQMQNHKAPEPTKEVLYTHARKKLDDDEIQIAEVDLLLHPDDCFCPRCGSQLLKVRKESTYEELDLTDEYQLVKHIPYSYFCSRCGSGVKYATKPFPHLMKQSMVSPFTVAYVMSEKYTRWISLDKQKEALARDFIEIDIGAMANWIVRCTDNWLKPLYRHMKQELLKQSVVHVASAPVQMVSDDGTPTPSDSRIYTYVTGKQCTPILLYEYNGKRPDAFLKGYTGCLVSDCSPEYTKIQSATHYACWLYMNDLWKEALDEGPETTDNQALKAILLMGTLLSQEQKCTHMDKKARLEFRRNVVAVTVEEFFLWVNTLDVVPGSKLAAAVAYAKEHQTELSAFLDNGEVSAVNAIAEGALEPFTTGKKVWHFSATPKGAQSSTIVYSLIQTAHDNGILPYNYLSYVLSRLPRISKTPSREELDALMPWNPELKKICNEAE